MRERQNATGAPKPEPGPFRRIIGAFGSAMVGMVVGMCAASLASAAAGPQAAPPAAAAQRPPAAPATPPVTGQRCLRCHREIVTTFGEGSHGRAAAFLKDSRTVTCDTCHGDPTKHNDSADPKDIQSPPKMPAAQVNATCLNCHSRDRTHQEWRGSAHDRKDMSCTSCHTEHHPKSPEKMLVKRTEQELCVTCHADRRKAIYQRSTHLFQTEHRDEKVECSSCHNPHGGEGRTMLQASSVNKLCYTCHADKRGPFLWEHAPVRENCLTCHEAHGSNQVKLLKVRSTMLCQQCHIHLLPRHQTVAGHDIFTFNNGCANCHSQVHGSNHPSGKAFTR